MRASEVEMGQTVRIRINRVPFFGEVIGFHGFGPIQTVIVLVGKHQYEVAPSELERRKSQWIEAKAARRSQP